MAKKHDTFYGDPDDPVDQLLCDHGYRVHTPKDGDELCEGHQAHYEWRDGKWT